MLRPMALPIRPSSLRNLFASRSSRNSHPDTSRSTHVSASTVESLLLPVAWTLAGKFMEHPRSANQVLSNESQAIPTIQVSPKKAHLGQHLELWVIESLTGRDGAGLQVPA